MKMFENIKSVKENYLDFVPVYNGFSYTINENGRVEIKMLNQGFYNRLAQIFFGRPGYSFIELDEFGTFVWQSIDGKRSVYDICMLIRDRFGEAAEPLFIRAVKFFQILGRCKFIVYKKAKGPD